MRADGGSLLLAGITVGQGAGGTLEGLNGSQVRLADATINGGTLASAGGGAVATTNASFGNVLSGVTLTGTLNIINNSAVSLAGTLTNNGVLNLQSVGNFTDLRVQGAQSILGNGLISLSNAGANRVGGTGSGDTLTLGSGQTLQGSGAIGAGSAGFVLVNQGTVIATQSNPLLINAAGGVTNTGTLRADGSTLQLQTTVNSGGGSIQALNGSQVQLLDGAVINNANFSASGAGSLITTVNAATVTLGGGNVSGPLSVANNSFLRLAGDVNLNGSLNLQSVGNFTDLVIVGARTLSGTATINLSNAAANRIRGAGAGDTLTLGSGQTLQGSGAIGAGSAGFVLVNQGTVIANQSNPLLINAAGGVTNTGTLRADGGTLQLQTTVNSGGGSIQALNGSQVQLLDGAVINNANFSASGAGSLITTVNAATVTLAGGNVSGPLTVANNSFLRLAGDVNLNGSLNLQSVGNFTDLAIDGTRALNGTASVNLSNASANRIRAANGPGDALTIGSGITVQGAGQVGAGTALQITNNGTLRGNVSNSLEINTSAGLTNNALVQGSGGTVLINGTQVTQSATGTLSAVNGGAVDLAGGTVVTGGLLSTTDTGVIRTVNAGTATLANLTSSGTVNVVNNSFLTLQGTVTNNGALNFNSVGNFTDLLVSGAVTLAGNGTTTLSNASANRIRAAAPGAQLTVGAGQTVQGSGQFGAGGAMALVNQGTITANQSNALNVDMTGAVQNAAGGLMQATGGANLNLVQTLSNAGTLAANGGVVNASAGFNGNGTALITGAGRLNVGAASTVGTLTHNGTASDGLALGVNNLTVSGDYTNTQAGVGNAFNKRAGVTGTGQILAGGNAAQAITGAGVANGNTANATLTLGNMRVGATTYNYQIANTGTTGPNLRGAIQTSVNGGNLTDSRLSGAGVTAANYSTGAPGANSGNLAVTFTAASAGALAPLSGQVLNLRSNFDNIADQKLNIVLAGGAAAYNAAVGSAASPVQVANQRVGGSLTAGVAVSNTAAAGSFSEDMNAFAGGTTGGVSASGSANGVLAGASNASGISVGVNTATAGAKSGTVSINFQTAGAVNGVSNGLGTASVGSQIVNVSGNVYQAASGAIQSGALNFGTVQVGQVVSQNLVVRNTASGAAGFVEDLHASFGATNGTGAGLISGTGSFSGILAGTNSTAGNGTMTVAVNTAAAGVVNGGIAVNYTTAGAVGGVSNGLGSASAGSENYGVAGTIQTSANVINQASPLLNNPAINLGTVRVGAASPTATVSLTNVATVAPQAALNATIAPTSGPITASGSFNLLAPGATNNANLVVGLNTGMAGNFTGANAGQATIGLVSDASNVGNCAPNCQLTLAPQTVSVSGKVYAAAVGQVNTGVVDFGIVRVGDAVASRNINVSNTAAVAGLNDTLRANLSGVGGAFGGTGSVSGVAAQAAGNISVSLNTASAGVFDQTGAVGLLSQNPDMADISAGADAAVQLKAQVNNIANGVFDLLGALGSISQVGAEDWVLDLGSLALSNTEYTLAVKLRNAVTGPADALSGLFTLTDADNFNFSGWMNALAGLDAGQSSADLGVGLLATMAGQFQDIIDFNGFSTNGSGPDLAQHRRLFIRATVFDPAGNVPEPGTLALSVMAALAGMVTAGRTRRRGVQKAAAEARSAA